MTSGPEPTARTGRPRPSIVGAVSAWLGSNRLGLVVMALVVGAGAGLSAAVFRWMVFGATWLVTGHDPFGQRGHAACLHLPRLGIWFVLLVPVLGGLIYGRTPSTSGGGAVPNGRARPSGASRWARCCSRCRRRTASPIR